MQGRIDNIRSFKSLAPTQNHDAFVCAFLLSNVRISASRLISLDAHYNLSLFIENEDRYPECKLNYGVSSIFRFLYRPCGTTRFFDQWNPLSEMGGFLCDYAKGDVDHEVVACLNLSPDLLKIKFRGGTSGDVNFISDLFKNLATSRMKYLTIVASIGWGLEDRELLPKVPESMLPKNYLYWGRG